MNKILRDIKIILLSIVISFGISLVYAWNGPLSTPPNNNTYTPINVSLTSQTKSGSLWAGAFLTTGGGYFGGNVGIGQTNPQAKLHIGGTAGVDGIMFPDGTVQTTAYIGQVQAPPGSQTFDSSGTFTVPANVGSITVEVRGGGGGGGTGFSWGARSGSSGGGGGGSGGYGRQTFTVNPGENYNITVGAGGSPGATGGISSFGSLISATGGNPGGNGVNFTPGGGGSGGTSAATYNVTGNSGSSGSTSSGGAGGSGVNGYGGGGGGGAAQPCCAYYSGSPGQAGQVIVSW